MDSKKLDKLIKLLRLANHNPNDSEANLAARAAAKMLGEENYRWVEDAKKNGGTPPKPKPESNSSERFYEDPRTGTLTITLTNKDIYSDSKIARLISELKSRLEPRTWNDVYRSTEPFGGYRKPPPHKEPPKYSRYEPPPRTEYKPFDDSDFGEDTGVDWEAFYRHAKAGGDFKDFFDSEAKRQQEKRDKERAAKAAYENQQQEARERARRAREGFNTRYTWNNPNERRTVYEKHCRDCSVCKTTQLTTDTSNPFICYQCKIKI